MMTRAIDRLFERLAATYGAAWDRCLGDAPLTDVKTAWLHELDGYQRNLGAIAYVLENLPERCPNVIEFRNLCRRAPAADVPRLPEPAADPVRVAAELSKLAPMQQAMAAAGPKDDKAWANKIIARYEYGQQIGVYALRCAHEALGLPVPDRIRKAAAPLEEEFA